MLNRRALLQGLVGAGAVGGVAAGAQTDHAGDMSQSPQIKSELPLVERLDGESDGDFYTRRYHDNRAASLFWQYVEDGVTKRRAFSLGRDHTLIGAIGILLDGVMDEYVSDFGIKSTIDADLILALGDDVAIKYLHISHTDGGRFRTCSRGEAGIALIRAAFAIDWKEIITQTPGVERVAATPAPSRLVIQAYTAIGRAFKTQPIAVG